MEQGYLYEAALTGDVEFLIKLLNDHRNNISLECVVDDNALKESALHIAAQFGHVDFARVLLDRRKDLVSQLNSRGQYPLHVASNREVARTLLEVNTDVCLVRDKDGRTPFHVAVMKGRLDVLEELINYRPRAAWVLTDGGEPLLHFCANNNRFDAFKMLVEKIKAKEFLMLKGNDNSSIAQVLHAKERYEEIELVSQRTGNNLPQDNDVCGRCSPLKIMDTLTRVLIRTKVIRGTKPGVTGPSSIHECEKDESEGNTEALMVVATLIATLSYTAMLNPPGGVWQEDGAHKNTINGLEVDHKVGQPVMSYKFPVFYMLFCVFNTIGFLASIILILVLVSKSRLRKNVFMLSVRVATRTAVLPLLFTYGFSILFMPESSFMLGLIFTVIILLGLVALGIVILLFQVFGRFIKWLPGAFNILKNSLTKVSSCNYASGYSTVSMYVW